MVRQGLLRDADTAAGNARSRAACRLHEFILPGMDDHCPADYGIPQAGYADVVNRQLVMRLTAVVSDEVPQITGVAYRIPRTAVRMTGWIVVAAGTLSVRRGAVT